MRGWGAAVGVWAWTSPGFGRGDVTDRAAALVCVCHVAWAKWVWFGLAFWCVPGPPLMKTPPFATASVARTPPGFGRGAPADA